MHDASDIEMQSASTANAGENPLDDPEVARQVLAAQNRDHTVRCLHGRAGHEHVSVR